MIDNERYHNEGTKKYYSIQSGTKIFCDSCGDKITKINDEEIDFEDDSNAHVNFYDMFFNYYLYHSFHGTTEVPSEQLESRRFQLCNKCADKIKDIFKNIKERNIF